MGTESWKVFLNIVQNYAAQSCILNDEIKQ